MNQNKIDKNETSFQTIKSSNSDKICVLTSNSYYNENIYYQITFKDNTLRELAIYIEGNKTIKELIQTYFLIIKKPFIEKDLVFTYCAQRLDYESKELINHHFLKNDKNFVLVLEKPL